MKTIKKLAIILTIGILFFECVNSKAQQNDEGIQKVIKIGEHVWMTENLNVDVFQNGDSIPEAKSEEEWKKAGVESKPIWSYYNYYSELGKKYGKLYNWYAVSDKRGLVPKGWHIPTEAEFQILVTDVNNDANALKAIGQGFGDGVGTNTSGFSALLAGISLEGFSYALGQGSLFWSSTENSSNKPYGMTLEANNSSIRFLFLIKNIGGSVRCIKD